MDMIERQGDPEFMTSLARGLLVLRTVAAAERPVTIADAARKTGLSRAAVRRCLHTLTILGYVGAESAGYVVRRQTLSLGHPYLSMTALSARAQPLLDALRDELGESCSLGVIDDDRLLYVARAEAIRIMSIGLRVGSNLPIYPTSMGRVLLAALPVEKQIAYLDRVQLEPLTPKTVTDRVKLSQLLRNVAGEGYCLLDEELEIGVRSIAVPVRQRGQVVAALNVATAAARLSAQRLLEVVLPPLREAAAKLSD